MTINELKEKVNSLLEYRAAIEELKNEAGEIEGLIKNYLVEMDLSELSVGGHTIHYTNVVSSRFDTKKFKEDLGSDVYEEYCKEVYSKRFSIT